MGASFIEQGKIHIVTRDETLVHRFGEKNVAGDHIVIREGFQHYRKKGLSGIIAKLLLRVPDKERRITELLLSPTAEREGKEPKSAFDSWPDDEHLAG